MSNTLQIEGLTKRFGNVLALDDFNLELGVGELVALLGPSGCGKTTALRIVAGLERGDSGRVKLGEKDLTDIPAHRRNMGMVFQAYSLFPNLTVEENVAFGLQLRKVDKAKRLKKAHELLNLVGLDSQSKRFPHQLSGGQQQRLCIARAIATEPEVILMDEPCSALDPISTLKIEETMHELKRSYTIIIVTHNMQQAVRVADNTAFFNAEAVEGGSGKVGYLVEFNATERIFNAPTQQATLDYVSGRFG